MTKEVMDKTGLMFLLLLAQSRLSLSITREYHYVPLVKTWPEAQSYCREHFADLATIETVEDWERVRSIVGNNGGEAWLGLYDDLNGWKWSRNNTYVYRDGNTGFGDWLVFTASNALGLEFCVDIYQGKLYDRYCGDLKKSVCYDEPTNKYIPVTTAMKWSSAQHYCREKYTDLTSIRNQQEKEEIMSVIDGSSWWIGLYRDSWTWSDQSDTSLIMWRSGEPSGRGEEPCVSTSVAGWGDYPCNDKMPFICSIYTMKLLKVVLRSVGSVDLDDLPVQQAILNHMEQHMKDNGIHHFRLRWRKQPNGKVFN